MCELRPFESVREGWAIHLFYREFDVLSDWLIDPVTLLSWPIFVFQCLVFVWMLAGMRQVMMTTGRATPTAIRLAATWLLLYPSTQLSRWSAGTLSQTLCGAAGVWLVGSLLEAFRTGARPRMACVPGQSPIVLLTAVGLWAVWPALLVAGLLSIGIDAAMTKQHEGAGGRRPASWGRPGLAEFDCPNPPEGFEGSPLVLPRPLPRKATL
jgi:hypothetical protein